MPPGFAEHGPCRAAVAEKDAEAARLPAGTLRALSQIANVAAEGSHDSHLPGALWWSRSCLTYEGDENGLSATNRASPVRRMSRPADPSARTTERAWRMTPLVSTVLAASWLAGLFIFFWHLRRLHVRRGPVGAPAARSRWSA